jgi:transposase InsO family protein
MSSALVRELPVEVLFEKICRDNGIKQRLTKPRSPTTTGKIERFHKTLRTEFLDHVTPFESIAARSTLPRARRSGASPR